MSISPNLDLPRVTLARDAKAARFAADMDAVFVLASVDAAPRVFADLPEAERWRELHARDKARAGTVRSTTLANQRQTHAVLGYIAAEASPFERLALAGRMLKELGGRPAENVALVSLLDRSTNEASLEALLAA